MSEKVIQRTTVLSLLLVGISLILSAVDMAMMNTLQGDVVAAVPIGSITFDITFTMNIGPFGSCVATSQFQPTAVCQSNVVDWGAILRSDLAQKWQAVEAFSVMGVVAGMFVILVVLFRKQLESTYPSYVKLLGWVTVGFCFSCFFSSLMVFALLLDVQSKVDTLHFGDAGIFHLVGCICGMISIILYAYARHQQKSSPSALSHKLLSDDNPAVSMHQPLVSAQNLNWMDLISPSSIQPFSKSVETIVIIEQNPPR